MSFKSLLGIKPPVSVDVIDFNAQHVATGQVVAYIHKLYREEEFLHLGYRFENRNGSVRFVIYALPSSRMVIQYFKDRCPAMVENECRALEGEGCTWNEWENCFKEVV